MMFETPEAIAKTLCEAGCSSDASARIANAAKVIAAFEPVQPEAALALGASKLGGNPDLPTAYPWPHRPAWPDARRRAANYENDIARWTHNPPSYLQPSRRQALIDEARLAANLVKEEAPLHFVGQIDLADATRAAPDVDPDIPREGRLLLFYDRWEEPWGFLGVDAVGLHVHWDRSPHEALRRVAPPASLRHPKDQPPEALGLRPCRGWVPVHPEGLRQLFDPLPKSLQSTYWDWWWTHGEGAEHRLGGWPSPLQGDMLHTCQLASQGLDFGKPEDAMTPAAQRTLSTLSESDWTLLWQIGSAEEIRLQWGDLGSLYLWIPRPALRARAFHKSWLILQCG